MNDSYSFKFIYSYCFCASTLNIYGCFDSIDIVSLHHAGDRCLCHEIVLCSTSSIFRKTSTPENEVLSVELISRVLGSCTEWF